MEISPDQVANEIITLVEHGKIQQEETKLLRTVSIFLNGALVLRFNVYFLVKEIHYEEEEVQKYPND